MATNENLIPIPGRLHSVATEGHVAGADEIYDDTIGKTQAEINQTIEPLPDSLAYLGDDDGQAVIPGFDPQTDTLHKAAQVLTTAEKDQVAQNLNNRPSTNGMARIELKATDDFKAVVEAQTGGNTIFVIKYDFTLTGDVTIPADCILEFDGGCISDDGTHTLTGNNTVIKAEPIKIFNNINEAGSWSVVEYYPEWFGAKGDMTTDDTDAIKTVLKWNSYDTLAGYRTRRNSKKIRLLDKTYLLTDTIYIPGNTTIEGTNTHYFEDSDQEFPTGSRLYFDMNDASKDAVICCGFNKNTGERPDCVANKYANGTWVEQNGGDYTYCRRPHLINICIEAKTTQRIGLTLGAAVGAYLENCVIEGFKTGIFVMCSWDITINHCKVKAADHGIYSVGVLNGCNISNCYINGSTNYEYIEANDPLAEGAINAPWNIYKDCSSAVYIRGGKAVQLDSCIIEHWDQAFYTSHSVINLTNIYIENIKYQGFGLCYGLVTINTVYAYLPTSGSDSKHKYGVLFWFVGGTTNISYLKGQSQYIAEREDTVNTQRHAIMACNTSGKKPGFLTITYNEEERNVVYIDSENGDDTNNGDVDNKLKTIRRACAILNGKEKNKIVLTNGQTFDIDRDCGVTTDLEIEAETGATITLSGWDGNTTYLAGISVPRNRSLTLKKITLQAVVTTTNDSKKGLFRVLNGSIINCYGCTLIPTSRLMDGQEDGVIYLNMYDSVYNAPTMPLVDYFDSHTWTVVIGGFGSTINSTYTTHTPAGQRTYTVKQQNNVQIS